VPFPALPQHTHRFHNGWDSPLGAQQSVAVQFPAAVNVSVQDVHSDHAGVHGVWVLLHGSRRDRFPGVAAKTEPKHKAVRRSSVTGVLLKLNPHGSQIVHLKLFNLRFLTNRPSFAEGSRTAAGQRQVVRIGRTEHPAHQD